MALGLLAASTYIDSRSLQTLLPEELDGERKSGAL